MPPEAYFPFVDAWLTRAPDALVFVATDQVSYLHRFEARYGRAAVVGGVGGAGRVLSSQAARRTDQLIHASSGAGRDGGGGGGESDSGGGARGVGSGGLARGRAALHDALLLSECGLHLQTYVLSLQPVSRYVSSGCNRILATPQVRLLAQERVGHPRVCTVDPPSAAR